ncbi:hypothetical protein E3N88_39052 [Mikania micrantha]|uniref:Integrase catalytic domain-containing protein n=1 Tax=Mikania micrantha TaxID=192012 RepID=A0A5N6LWI7_9ASTR|nr:hypothetical protein E3N88_39052 [Mikania micrantha]
MTSLPASYEAFKINYNTHKEKWMMNELIAMCVQEEERQKLEKPDVAYLMATGSKKRKNNTHKEASKVPKSNAGASSSSNNSNGKSYCKFCRKVGHKQKDCPDFKEWLAKRGPKLDMDGFYVSHGNGRLTISSNSQVFGTGLLDGGLYKLELDDDFSRSLLSYNINENSTKTKRKRDLETSSMLWHQRLGHISRDRLSRLVKDEVLPSLDFTDFGTCFKCLKGKMTTATKKDYKTEVENQLDLKIKVVRSDRGGEYYGRHTDMGQAPGPFYEFCKGQGIVNQYTMPGTPQQNGVAERRNRTLMNMTEALKTTVHILNRVPSKSVPKTPYELWTGRKPSLRYMKVWGCLAEAKLYNPFLKKLDMKTVICYFIGYPDHSKGYRFYCPTHVTRIVESKHAHFLEDSKVSGSSENPDSDLQEVQDAGGRHSSTNLPPITPLVHHATPNFTAPTPTQSGLTTAPNVAENEGTSSDQHQHNTSHAEPANQLRRFRQTEIVDRYILDMLSCSLDTTIRRVCHVILPKLDCFHLPPRVIAELAIHIDYYTRYDLQSKLLPSGASQTQ